MSTQPAQMTAPGLKAGTIPRTLREFPRNPIKFCQELVEKYGDVVRFWIGPYLVHLITNPDDIKHVLQDNNQNYVKGRIYEAFKPIIGNGLLTSEESPGGERDDWPIQAFVTIRSTNSSPCSQSSRRSCWMSGRNA